MQNYPNFYYERKFRKLGYKIIIGIDETGRGPLAGPVVVAAVSLKPEIINSNFLKRYKVKDSKKLSVKKRIYLFDLFKKEKNIKWQISKVSAKVIDKINIFEATKLAAKRAVTRLIEKNKFPISKTILILDGRMKLNLKIAQKSIVKADEKIVSCSIASIFAKVKRDKIMEEYHRKFSQYGFNKHKGYGTKEHFKAIKKYKLSKIHRKSFKTLQSQIS